MKTVYSTLDVAHGLIVRIALADARIKFFLFNENASTTDVGSPAAPLTFQVSEKDFAKAEKVIREAVARIHPKKRAGTRK